MASDLMVIAGQLLASVVQLVVGLAFSMGSIYIGIKLFDRFTGDIEEWKEMKKGNVAVGVLLCGIILSISLIVENGVSSLTTAIQPGMAPTVMLIAFMLGLINLLISLVMSIIAVYAAIKILDWITTDIDEMAELRKGNIAVGLMMAAVLVSVSLVIRGAVAGVTQIVSAVEIFRLIGL